MELNAGFSAVDGGFDLHFAGRLVLRHRADAAVLDSARGNPAVTMYRGNFKIEDAPEGQVTPIDCVVEDTAVTLIQNAAAVARPMVPVAPSKSTRKDGFGMAHPQTSTQPSTKPKENARSFRYGRF